jgi:hypothetical protein
MGQNIPSLNWFFDEIEIVRYFHRPGDESMVPLDLPYDGDFGPIQITSVQISPTTDDINVTSTFTAGLMVLKDFGSIQCGSRAIRSELVMVDVSVLGKSHNMLQG